MFKRVKYFDFQAELPPEQVEPVDLSVKIKVETVAVPVRDSTPEPKSQYCSISPLSRESDHTFNLSHTNDVPYNFITKHHLQYEANNNNNHIIINNESKYSPISERQCSPLPGLIIAPTTLNSPISSSSGHSNVSLISSQFTSNTKSCENVPVRGSPLLQETSPNCSSPTQSISTVTSSAKKSPTNSPSPSVKSVASPVRSLVSSPLKIQEEVVKASIPSLIKTENLVATNYSGSIVTSPLPPVSIHISGNSLLPIPIANGIEPKEGSTLSIPNASSDISTQTRIMPPGLHESMVVGQHPVTSLASRLVLPTPQMSQEALTNLMKEHHAHPHFPLHMAHFQAGLPIPITFDPTVKQGEYLLSSTLVSYLFHLAMRSLF